MTQAVDFDEDVERVAKGIFARILGWEQSPTAVEIAWMSANQEWYRRVVRERAGRMMAHV